MNCRILLKKMINITNENAEKLKFDIIVLPIVFFKYIHEGYLSLENTDLKQSNFTIKLNNFEKGSKTLEKSLFLNNLGFLFSTREKVLNKF